MSHYIEFCMFCGKATHNRLPKETVTQVECSNSECQANFEYEPFDAMKFIVFAYPNGQEQPSFLSEDTRDEVKKYVAESIEQGSFGDGLEREYSWSGCTLVGADEMSDHDLARKYGETCDFNEDDDLWVKVMAEFETYKLLNPSVSPLFPKE